MGNASIAVIEKLDDIASLTVIAQQALDNPVIRKHLQENGYCIRGISEEWVKSFLIMVEVGIGCFSQDGADIILDERRRTRALHNLQQLVFDAGDGELFDPVGVITGTTKHHLGLH